MDRHQYYFLSLMLLLTCSAHAEDNNATMHNEVSQGQSLYTDFRVKEGLKTV